MAFESRLYHYGLGIGVPYRALNTVANAFDLARNARDVTRRRQLARSILKDSKWGDFVPKDRGFAAIGPDTLPGMEEVLEAVRDIIADRRRTGWKARTNNPFYQLERPEDFRDYPALINFSLSAPMLEIVCGYYGMVPQLKEIGIWLTPPQTHQFSSQLYHLDKPESQLLKLFLNVDSNTEDVGPLTLLPADISKTVRQNTSYEAIYFRGDGRLTDEQVFSHCSPSDQVSIAGEAGNGGFADTSVCFHYGSRCRAGERKMFVVSFMLPHKARKTRTPLFDLVPTPTDEIRRLILCGAAFGKH